MSTLIFIVLVFAIYLIVYRYPGTACGLVLVSFAVEQYAQATVPITAAISPLCNYLTAGAVLLAVVSQCIHHGLGVLKLRAPGILVLSLLGYCYASWLWSLFPSTTERLLATQLPVLVVFVGLAPMAIRRVEDMEHAVLALVIGATLALLGLILSGEWARRSVVLLNGDESNPLAMAQAAGSLFVAASLTNVLPKYFSKAWPLVAALVAFAVLLTFLRSGSRGQVIAATGVVLLFSTMRKGRRWIPLAMVGVLMLLATGYLTEEVEHNATRWDIERVDSDMRDDRAGAASALLKVWSHSAPLRIWAGLGHGAAQDPRLFGRYPHVVPAEVLAEEGVLGFCIYLAGLVLSALTYWKAFSSQDPRNQKMIVGASAMALYEFMLTLKQGTLTGNASFLLLLVISGPLSDNRMWRKQKLAANPPSDSDALQPIEI